METKELIRRQIEEERMELNRLAGMGEWEALYRQSVVVDRLLEKYLAL